MANTNIINAVFGSGICAVTTSAFRANYGMILRFSGIDLPAAFEVDFSNYDVMGRDSITAIGQNGEVQIPDDLWDSGLNIYAYVYLHPTDDSGVTVYTVTIPVLGRPNRTDETPTPHEQSVIEQAISALNDAVEQTAADVASADASAQAAAQSEANASVSERAAAASASAALASQNAAESASRSATESASGAAESARNAAQSASQAAESATSAQASAEQAERSVQSITDDVERAERAANTATGKATEAASSAATASTKATQAEQSATAAAQSASSASTAAQNAAESEQLAQSHATDANTAKQDAQDAQAAAEQAAESVSGLSAQIEQNTADIADLVQSKAGALIDTASGSIASFVPDATVPTVKGLSVDIEPVQDLHGYDAPWPAGGGKQLLNPSTFETFPQTLNGITATLNEDGNISLSGTATTTIYIPIIGYKYLSEYGFIEADTSYTLSGYYSSSAYCMFGVYGSGTDYADNTGSGKAFTFNASKISSLRYRLFIYVANGSTLSNAVIKPMICKSSATNPTTFAPYSNICPISGWDAVEVTRTGKNLLDSMFSDGKVPSVSSGALVNANNACRSDYIPVNSGSVTFSCKNTSARAIYCFLYGENKDFLLYATSTGNSVTGTHADAKYAMIRCDSGATAPDESMLELGSTATAYEPYAGDTYTIQLGQTVYGGTVDAVNGVLTVDRAMVIFDGTERWYKYGTPDSTWTRQSWRTDALPYSIKSRTTAWGECISNGAILARASSEKASSDDDVITCRPTAYESKVMYIFTPLALDMTVEQLTAMLHDNPLQFCYPLATPITISLTPLEISVLTGQTNNVWADSGDVSVEYAADLKTYIDNKIAAAVAALS